MNCFFTALHEVLSPLQTPQRSTALWDPTTSSQPTGCKRKLLCWIFKAYCSFSYEAYSISYQCTSGSLIANQMFVRVPGLLKSSKYYVSPWPIPMIRYKRKLFRVRTKLSVKTKRFTPTDDLSLRDNDKTWNKCVWL